MRDLMAGVGIRVEAVSPELADGSTIPHNQTSSPVQFNQVLTALQSETREELQTFLREYSEALRMLPVLALGSAATMRPGTLSKKALATTSSLARSTPLESELSKDSATPKALVWISFSWGRPESFKTAAAKPNTWRRSTFFMSLGKVASSLAKASATPLLSPTAAKCFIAST